MRCSYLYFASVAGLAALLPATADDALAQEVVQPLPDPAERELSNALARLSSNPRNVPALIAAGNASLRLGDPEAALGFFNRAQRERPSDPRVLTGLAVIAVGRGEAVTAIQLFDNANLQGGYIAPYAAERGLAYDLIGNNRRAQRLYRQALSRAEDDEVVRRLALSYAISGDAEASETTLLPLLQRQDRRAFRTRAFALAILGRDEEAQTIAETMLPPRLSQRLAPYLQYMPRLTPAQQAAAANQGRFPAVAQIGQDSAEVRAMAEAQETSTSGPAGNDRLTPSGEPLGPAAAAAADEVVFAEAEPVVTEMPPAQLVTPEPSGELPALASTTQPAIETTAPPPRQPSPVEVATQEIEASVDAAIDAANPSLAQSTDAPRPSFSISEPVAFSEPEEQTGEQLELAEAFADFRLPPGGLPIAPAAGAVDISTIEPARPETEPEAVPEPAQSAHPSRHWVQVATGQDVAAFRFDWRRIVRSADGLLDGREAFTAPWNATNRLVTGPFESRSEAQQMVSRLGEAGVDAFRFTSAEGEEVRPIS